MNVLQLQLKYTMPTKQHDGGARPTNAKPHRVGGPGADAFSRYSSDLFRIKALLLRPEEKEGVGDLEAARTINKIFRNAGLSDPLDINHLGNGKTGDASSKRRRVNSSRCVQHGYERKTRLSFELHPDLLLHDIMEQLYLAESSGLISDEEEPEDEEQTNKGREDKQR